MAIDILSATRAKAADAANARAAPPIPTFDAGKMFSQMLEQSFSARDAARQQASLRSQAPTREERPVPAAKPEEPAARPAAARPAPKERPAAQKPRDDDDDTTVDAKAKPADDDGKPVDGDKEVAAKADDQSAGQDAKPRQDQADQASQAAVAQVAAAVTTPAAAQPKIEAKPEQDGGAADAAAALAARSAQTAPAAATAQTAAQDKPADAPAAALQAMTPQQVSEVANFAAPAAKAAKAATDGVRDTFSQAEAALADLLADIGGGSIVSAPSGGNGAGTGGRPGGGLLDGAAWSLMQQAPGVSTGGTTQAMSFAGLLQAGLSAMAEGGGGDDAAVTSAAAAGVEATAAATTAALPLAAGIMQGVDGPDMPHAAAQAQAARPALPLPVADQVAAHLGKAIKDEVKAINVQLNPEELGRVDIRLEFGADGKVSAHVTADNQQALDLLQRDQRALERSLTDAGLKTDNSSLSFSLRNDGAGNDGFNRFAQNQGGNQGGPGQQRGGRGNAVADVGGVDAAPATARPRTVAADGALDIKV